MGKTLQSKIPESFPLEMMRCSIQALASANFPINSLQTLPLPQAVYSDKPAEPHETIPLHLAAEVFRLCKSALDDESYGFDDRGPQPPDAAKLVLISALSCSRNFGDMLDKQTQFALYMKRDNEFTLTLDNSLAMTGFIREAQTEEVEADYLQASDLIQLFWWYRIYCWFLDEVIELESINVMGPDYGFSSYLISMFSCPVQFNQPAYSMCFSQRYLAYPVVRQPSDIDCLFDDFATTCLSVNKGLKPSTTDRVMQQLQQTPIHQTNLELLSEKLFCSKQTLVRRLRLEGTSFQVLKDDYRRDLAIQLLADPGKSIGEVSDRLGFSNAPAFTRAFKKWTGLSPSKNRE